MSDYSQPIRFDSAHPSLPGHFPGLPLVPGGRRREQGARARRAWRGQRLSRVIEAKFVAPLLPDESAQLQLSDAAADASRIGFSIERDGTVLARGIVEGAA